MSEALGEFLARHLSEWEVLADAEALTVAPSARQMRHDLLVAVGAEPVSPAPVASGAHEAVLDGLRIAYRRALLGIAARDLSGLATMDTVAQWLSDLADCVLDAALAVARAEVGDAADLCRFAVIGMGKCGARELNYVSDVDVIFVAEAADGADESRALSVATSLASGLMRACMAATPEGTIWEVDANLRPEGKQGALVRTVASHVGYYERWAKTWEFQALLKARPVAGDLELGREYVDSVSPFVWSAADHPTFVEDVQAMRRRVEQHVPARLAERELKLGPGGLRDVEFSVQLLQLVHGRSDVMLRSPTTMVALESLATWGYVGRDDAATLAEAYRFLRTLEHRIQLHRLRRTHTMPDDEAELRRLGRSLGFRQDPVGELVATWRRHAREVRRLHEKLFYRPLLQAVARLDAGEARLSLEAAEQRLAGPRLRRPAERAAPPAGAHGRGEQARGDPAHAAARHARLVRRRPRPGRRPARLPAGERRARVDALVPATAARRVRRGGAARPRARHEPVRDRPAAAGARVGVDAGGRGRPGAPRRARRCSAEVLSVVDRHEDPVSAVAAIRSIRRRELFRIAVAELLHVADPGAGRPLALRRRRGGARGCRPGRRDSAVDPQGSVDFAVIGMGRFGGRELGFASDIDVMFVYEARPGVDDEAALRAAAAIAEELRRLLMAPSGDPPLDIDADLRPEGKQGPLVRSLGSYAAYYERWSATWEAQALLRADMVAGDEDLGAAFLGVIDPLRWIDRAHRRRRHRGPPAQGPDGVRATAAGRRPEPAHQARARRPQRRRVGGAAAADARTPADVPSLRTTRTLDALEAAPAGRPDRRPATPPSWRPRGAWRRPCAMP